MKTFIASLIVSFVAFRMWRAARERREGGR